MGKTKQQSAVEFLGIEAEIGDCIYSKLPERTCVSGMSLDELHSELSTQEILYNTEKDINKTNQANWRMTVLLNEICKRKGLGDYH